MGSQLKVDTITGVTTAGSVAVTGEGNSTTTNLQQGLAKSWVTKVADGTSMKDNFNVASMTDSATGIFAIAFTNNHGNDDYASASCVQPPGNTTVVTTCELNTEALVTTSGYTGETCYVNSSNNRTDYDYPASVVTFGDLA